MTCSVSRGAWGWRCWLAGSSPLQDIAGDDERPGDRPIQGDLPVSADIDQYRGRAHRLPGLSGRRPAQAASRRRKKLINSHPYHLDRVTRLADVCPLGVISMIWRQRAGRRPR